LRLFTLIHAYFLTRYVFFGYPQVMARFARVIAPGYPHDFTQRGNRRRQTFFSNADYEADVCRSS